MVAMKAVPGEENALLFSLQKKRISVHAVENLVEKYVQEFVPQKKITPHKLRSTFGTNLYQSGNRGIYILSQMFWDMRMSGRQRSIMRLLKTKAEGKRRRLLSRGKKGR